MWYRKTGLDSHTGELQDMAKLANRLDAVEEQQAIDKIKRDGGISVGGGAYARRGIDLAIAFSMYSIGTGVVIGPAGDGDKIRIPSYMAPALRDWLIKEFPIEAPKKAVKK